MNPTQQPAGRADVVRELGALDDLAVAKILALGPTVAALVEARVVLAEGDAPRGARRSPGPVVERIVDLVRDLLAREEADVDEPDLSLA
jgi:hypothetical protein